MQLQPTSVSTVTTQLSSLTIDDSRFTDRHTQFTTDHSPFHTAEAQMTFLMFASGDEAAPDWMYNRFYGPLIRYSCSRLDDSVEVPPLSGDLLLALDAVVITSLWHAYQALCMVVCWSCAETCRQ